MFCHGRPQPLRLKSREIPLGAIKIPLHAILQKGHETYHPVPMNISPASHWNRLKIPWQATSWPHHRRTRIWPPWPLRRARRTSWRSQGLDMVVSSSSWGYPKLAGWFISGKIPIYKWMMTRGTPYFGKPPYLLSKFCSPECPQREFGQLFQPHKFDVASCSTIPLGAVLKNAWSQTTPPQINKHTLLEIHKTTISPSWLVVKVLFLQQPVVTISGHWVSKSHQWLPFVHYHPFLWNWL